MKNNSISKNGLHVHHVCMSLVSTGNGFSDLKVPKCISKDRVWSC